MKPESLLKRLDDIGHSLAQSGHALALIGLGSVGEELQRLDEYSDLDFFVIVEPRYKDHYIENLEWIRTLCPIAYHFPNTEDGYKLLFEDGIFCEFAVFDMEELTGIPFSPSRIIWKRSDVPENINRPTKETLPPKKRDKDWLMGEALTNIYVGMGRDKRGEKLSAARFIQLYAVDRLLELTEYVEPTRNAPVDIFANERRFEQRYPETTQALPSWIQGYKKNRESALAILSFLEKHFDVDQTMAMAIRELCS